MVSSVRVLAGFLTPVALGLLAAAPVVGQQPPAPAPNGVPNPAPGAQPNPPAGTPQTNPAEQQYGPPRNPVTGGPVDMDLTKPLSLERAIEIGLARQNAIAIARTQVDASNDRVTEARSSYYPQITPTFQYQSLHQPGSTLINGQPRNRAFDSDTRTEALTARQLLLDSGQREANVGLSRRNLFAAEYGLGDTRENVIVNVATDYYTLLRDRELVRVEQQNLVVAQTTLDAIQTQVQVGNAAQSDTLQAQSNVANAQVTVLNAQNQANLDQAALKNAMGVITSQPLILPDKAAPPPLTPDPNGLESYVNRAYANRWDIKQQVELIEAQGYSVRLAKINAGVNLNATFSEGYQLDPDAGEVREFLVTVSYPLFDGGNTRAAVREAKAGLEQQQRVLDQLEQTVRLDVEQDYLTREQAKQTVSAAQTAVQAGQQNYDVALAKQKAGLVNVLDVLNAQVLLVTAQVALVQSIYDFYIADQRLLRDIGMNDPAYLPHVPRVTPPMVRQPLPGPSPAIATAAPGAGVSPVGNSAATKP